MIGRMDERTPRPLPPTPAPKPDSGPTRPTVRRPETNELWRRMKRVDPDAARKYRQRSGQ